MVSSNILPEPEHGPFPPHSTTKSYSISDLAKDEEAAAVISSLFDQLEDQLIQIQARDVAIKILKGKLKNQ